MNEWKTPRGTRDLLPNDAEKFRKVEEVFTDICRRYGYREARTPLIEHESVFTRTVGEGSEIVQKQMYTFSEKGGRTLCLRPEGTAACARAYINHTMWQKEDVTKWYYIGPMFRYERPQKGRERQFFQVGLECFGYASPAVDVEQIQMGVELLQRAYPGRFVLLINNVGCRNCRPSYERKLKEVLSPILSAFCDLCHMRYKTSVLRIFDCKNTACQKQSQKLPRPLDFLCDACKEHWNKLKALLKKLCISFEEDALLVRGIDYYTRTTFELVSKEEKLALIGGGRYDDLVQQMGGKDIPAAGFAAGVDRIAQAMDTESPLLDVWLLPMEEQFFPLAIEVASKLRQQNFSCHVDASEKAIKTRVKWASRNARFGIFLGEQEARENRVQLKNFSTGSQHLVTLPEAIQKLTEEKLSSP